jgi:hypothetical protein
VTIQLSKMLHVRALQVVMLLILATAAWSVPIVVVVLPNFLLLFREYARP